MSKKKSDSTITENHGDKLLTRVEAAIYLGVRPGTLAVWDSTKRYDLQPIKVGKLVKYKVSSLDRFLKERMSP